MTTPTIPELLVRNAKDFGERVALSSPERRVTHHDLQARTACIACHLKIAGINRNDHVAVLLDRCVEAVESILAITRAGAVAVPLDPRSSRAELMTICDDVWSNQARWIITDSAGCENIRSIDDMQPAVIWTIDQPSSKLNTLPYNDLLTEIASTPPDDLAATDKAFLHYTSGSTGDRPKGVVSSQEAWIRSTLFSMTTDLKAYPDDKILCPLPITHAYGFSSGVMVGLCTGASLHMTGDRSLAEDLTEESFTIILGVPTTYSELVSLYQHGLRLSTVRLCNSGGAPASPSLNEQVKERLGLSILNHYGCTETCGAITVCRAHAPYVEGSSGSLIPGREIRIVDPESAQQVADGEEGEIWIRSPSLLMQYHNDSRSPFEDGWYRSGDLGRWDDQHNLIITGRLKEAIVRGGYKIHPAEIERVLNTCGGVKESVVVAASHDVFGEVPVALVVTDQEPPALQSLLKTCRDSLTSYKVPTHFFEIDSIPRTRGGKPRRRAAASVPRRRIHAGSLTSAVLETAVLEEFSHARGLPKSTVLDPAAEFGDMGMNSLVSIVVRDRLVSLTGFELPISLLFDYTSPRSLAEYIHRRISGERPILPESQPPPMPSSCSADEPIAVVSMACRYPGDIKSPEDLWRAVEAGIDVTSDFPTDRGWDTDALYNSDPDNLGTTTTRRGGFLHGMADFDAGLFGMSPKEAEATDPQQRLLLESTWELLERGRMAPTSLRGSDTGVYVGMMYNDYAGRFIDTQHELEAQLGLGSAASVAAGRISHTFDFRGPSLSVDTACSSSLVAIDLAAKALKAGECSLAIAGGVTVMATPQAFVMFSKQRGLSPDGNCRSYSDDADGTAWSEGVGLLLLERLSDARRNEHQIHGLIRGIATNSDGRSSTLTAPSGKQQERVIQSALRSANLSHQDVDVIEGHGTATVLGDLIEVRGLMNTYGQERSQPALLGSLKSNLGHTQAAAGVGSIIKMVMAMQKCIVPPNLHAEKPSRHVDWSNANIKLITKAQPWPKMLRRRRAAVSAFGIGGTNAHVILEQDEKTAGTTSPVESKIALLCPWLLSGADQSALRAQARIYQDLCNDDPVNVAFSLATTRSHLRWRAAVPPGDVEALDALAEGRSHPRLQMGMVSAPRLVVLFSGQGVEFPWMLDELCNALPIFRWNLEKTFAALDPHLEEPLLAILERSPSSVHRTDIAQTVLFAFQTALFRTLEHFGIVPAYVIGHSLGEITAAHVSGILPLGDAAKLVTTRGRLMHASPQGAMMSVMASESQVMECLSQLDASDSAAVIAAVNAEDCVVVSGTRPAISAVEEDCRAHGRRTKRLNVSHAFHSPSMGQILPELLEVLDTISFGEQKIPIVSTVTGKAASDFGLRSPEYWARQVIEPVQFADAVRTSRQLGATDFLEIGPTASLVAHVGDAVATQATARCLLDALSYLHVQGCDVAWSKVFEGSGARNVDLPTYPFQRRRYWLDPPKRSSTRRNMDHPFLERAAPSSTSGQTILSGRISLKEQPWLKQHAMSGRTILPATAFAEIVIRAGQDLGLQTLDELTLLTPLDVSEDGEVDLQIVIEELDEDQGRTFSVSSRPQGAGLSHGWTHHASGRLGCESSRSNDRLQDTEWPADGEVDMTGSYTELASLGIAYGPDFQCVDHLWRTSGGFNAKLSMLGSLSYTGFLIHPAILDAAMHAQMLINPGEATARLPFQLAGVRIWHTKERTLRAVGLTRGDDQLSVRLFDSTGRRVAEIESVYLRPMAPRSADLFTMNWSPMMHRTNGDKSFGKDLIIRFNAQSQEGASVEHIHKAVKSILASIRDWHQNASSHNGQRLIIVTERATSDDPDMTCAAVWGFVRSAQSESSESICLIDIDGSAESELALQAALSTDETVLAIRNGDILAPKLVRETRQVRGPRKDFSGTVLITGGTGALGRVLARHLVEKHDARSLLLISRTGPQADNHTFEDLHSLDARIVVKACDVANYEQLECLLKITDPPVSAVFHAAGIIDDCLLDSLTPKRISKVLRPKVDGAWNLHRLLPQARPFVLFSSAAGILGNPGQANYAAANTFLDALAKYRTFQGLHGLSLAWGPWKNADGLAGKISDFGPLLPLSDEQGMELLDEALLSTQPVLAPLLIRDKIPAISQRITEEVKSTNGSVTGRRELMAMSSKERRSELQRLIRVEVASALGYDQLPDLPFTEIGLDSLSAVMIRNKISTLTGVNLPSTVLFETENVVSLARLVLEKLDEAADDIGMEDQDRLTPTDDRNGGSERAKEMRLTDVCQQLCIRGNFSEVLALLAIASLTLPVFKPFEIDDHVVSLRRLRSGKSGSAIVCLQDFLPSLSDKSIFDNMVPFMGTDFDVFDITYPTGVVPDSLATLVNLLARSITASLQGMEIVIVGYSAGGLVAHALARALKDTVAGLILLDTYPITKDVPNWLAALPGRRILDLGERMSDQEILTMGHYMRLTQDYAIESTTAPILLLRASEPIAEMEGREWKASWPNVDCVVEAPGNHMSLLREDAKTTAAAVTRWTRDIVSGT